MFGRELPCRWRCRLVSQEAHNKWLAVLPVQVAVYCDENKKQHAFTAVCPHLGCIVHVGRCSACVLASRASLASLPPLPVHLPCCLIAPLTCSFPLRCPCLAVELS